MSLSITQLREDVAEGSAVEMDVEMEDAEPGNGWTLASVGALLAGTPLVFLIGLGTGLDGFLAALFIGIPLMVVTSCILSFIGMSKNESGAPVACGLSLLALLPIVGLLTR